MQPGIQLSSTVRIALIIAVIAAAVIILHIISRSEKFPRSPRKYTLLCFAVLLAGFAGLFVLSRGGLDPRELPGFKPFAAGELSAAAEAVEDSVALEYSSGEASGAELTEFGVVFENGEFSRMDFTAALSGGDEAWSRSFRIVTPDNRLASDRRVMLNPGSAGGVIPVESLSAALSALEAANWDDALAPGWEGLLSLSLERMKYSPAELSGSVYVLDPSGLSSADAYPLEVEMPVLTVDQDGALSYILINM